ncbi:transglutaminase family protein [Raineyella fluvialis]|uniref:Transglutaminase family protein n=1 Tax=Raineyella fluvialis TaxID=2662261 RepID=A0A5Q2FDZ2_9ACTN|nr:transglutaminase family protein [Raineyella fluvialis]QGF22486.1 transglutaminase family protein [Raineyella fluvialis]
MRTYRIRHETAYHYEGRITSSYGLYHLAPQEDSRQHLLGHRIDVTPVPSDRATYVDVYGNTRTWYHVTAPHTDLVIVGTTDLTVGAQTVEPQALAEPWERCRPDSRRDVSDWWRAVDLTLPSPRVDIRAEVAAYAAPSFPAGRPLGEAVEELNHRIHADFAYDPRATSVTTRVDEVLRIRAGVCQDFAQLMVACLRSVGLAGRYVSGYLATIPPPGRPRNIGADATHAWAGVWVPGAGWYDLDPTNDRPVDESHATVAWGRDYSDVAPVRGVIYGEAGRSAMKVSVDMAPIEASTFPAP